MELKTFKVKVREVVKETGDSITIKFEHLPERLKYKSGQFITLILKINGQEVRRSYSLSSSPYVDEHLSVCVKAVPKGLVSNELVNKIKPGDEIEVLEPMGHFSVEPLPGQTRHCIFFAAGSGITPLISIIKTVLSQEPNSKVTLVYGNRDRNSIIYKKELEQLENKYQQRFNLIHVLSQPDQYWVGYTGRINQATAVNLIQKVAAITHKQCYFYLCGPQGMMEEVLKALDLLSVPKELIFKESFHATPAPQPNTATATPSASNKSKVKIIDGSKTYEFEVEPNQTILETGLKKGFNLPYSCQAGMCTACMGKCTTGKVHMDNPDGLTDNEVAKGFVLTCIGYPAAPEIVIEL